MARTTLARPRPAAPPAPRGGGRETAAVLWAAGAIGVALAAGLRAGMLSPPLPAGAQALTPIHGATRAAGLEALAPGTQAGLAVAAVALAAVTFLYVLREAWRGSLSLRLVLTLGIAFQLLGFVLPLLFSRDVYSYAIYGRIWTVYHHNPYVVSPNSVPTDPLFPFVGPRWRGTPAVYGPAFTLLSGAVTKVLRRPAAEIWAFKAIAAAASVATLMLIGGMARRLWPERAAFAAALFGLNPVVAINGVGGGHNDLIVALTIAGAAWLVLVPPDETAPAVADGSRPLRLSRTLAAAALLTLGAMVKATALIVLVLLVAAVTWRRPAGRRLRVLAAHGGVAVAVALAVSAPFLQTHDPTLGQATLATHQGWLAPSRFVRVTLGRLVGALAGDTARNAVEAAVRIAFPVAFLVAFVFLVRWLARRAEAGGVDWRVEGATWGWALLLFTMAAPVLQTWYVAWILPVLWLMPRSPLVAGILLSFLLSLSQPLAEAGAFPHIFDGVLLFGHYVLSPVVLLTFVLLLADLRRRSRDGIPLEAELAIRWPRARLAARASR